MVIAILSDIHGNREAFDACRDKARRLGADRFALIGDLVGYGADPEYIVDEAMRMRDEGAILVRGNHDAAAACGDGFGMNDYARAAIEWTWARLGDARKAFLRALPMEREEGEALFVHAEASHPERWTYVTGAREAERSICATEKRVTFCGHVHRPQLYNLLAGRPAAGFTPQGPTPTPLLASRRWLAVMGAVGQPRDENPHAAFGLYDTRKRTVAFWRADYDIEGAAEKIRRAGLPPALAARLYLGR